MSFFPFLGVFPPSLTLPGLVFFPIFHSNSGRSQLTGWEAEFLGTGFAKRRKKEEGRRKKEEY
ncbi:MAG: hypothetical protein HC786_29865 [Richelia sp. CSU_2_1]|nr:hypothetical protein [Microcoleus sp. SU_5_6]NJR26014.1 hypothetical protein [Richelia sp. CSU_2_1]